jgi:hypothetical protein
MMFDVFESQEAFDSFAAVSSPIATEAGIEEPPKSYPVHTFTPRCKALHTGRLRCVRSARGMPMSREPSSRD